METQLATQSRELAAPQSQPSIFSILQAMAESGGVVNSETASVVEKLLSMQREMEANEARKAFALAFLEVQREMPVIQATKAIPDKAGRTKFKYAPLEDIMDKAGPVLKRNGFIVTFDIKRDPPYMIAFCKLLHKAGHESVTQSPHRVGQGPVGANESQADGAAITYAKRYALCSALGIIVEQDTDARNDGGEITHEQVLEIEGLLSETKTAEADFLAWANFPSIDAIPLLKFASFKSALLRKREKMTKSTDMHPTDQTF